MSITYRELPSKIYYDVNVFNEQNTAQQNNLPPILTFNETRNNPLLYDPQQYYMSVIRFQLDTPSLPVFIPIIQQNQADPNLTIYEVTLDFSTGLLNYSTTVPIIFVPQSNLEVPPPPSQNPPSYSQVNNTGYYYLYSYQFFIGLINTALESAITNLNTYINNSGGSPIYPIPNVVMTWDTTKNTAILNLPLNAFGYIPLQANTPFTKLYFNAPLYQLFSSFPGIYDYTIPRVLIDTDDFGGQQVAPFPPSTTNTNPDYISVYQEYSTVSLWTPISSIVFCSNTLPIVPNQISSPKVFYNGNIIQNGNNSNIAQIITDFIADDAQYKPTLIYNPTAQYRLIELLGNTPLNNFDLTVYWKDRLGFLNPFRLTSGSSASIKILFTKKFINPNLYKDSEALAQNTPIKTLRMKTELPNENPTYLMNPTNTLVKDKIWHNLQFLGIQAEL